MRIPHFRDWRPRALWGASGLVIGASAVYLLRVADRLDIPGKWDPDSQVSIDTIGTWLGAIATVVVAAVAGWNGKRIRQAQAKLEAQRAKDVDRLERQRAEDLAKLRAYDIKFRVRLGTVDMNGYYRTWRVAMRTSRSTPALNATVLYNGAKLGPELDRIPDRKNWWVWETAGQMELDPPTKDEIAARRHIKGHVRHRLEVQFSIDGYRFARTTTSIRLIDRPARNEVTASSVA